MMEYLKRKFWKLEKDDSWTKNIPYPRYYEENGLLIKETEDGRKFAVTLDEQHNEVILGQIK